MARVSLDRLLSHLDLLLCSGYVSVLCKHIHLPDSFATLMSSLQRQHKNAPLAPSLKCSKADYLGDLVDSTLFCQMNLEQT